MVFPAGMPRSKRVVDLLIATIGLIFFSPVLLVIALLVGLTLGKPILFRQVRTGFRGRPFGLYKFRTMTAARGRDGELLPDEQRLGRFGRFLRSVSLDELPELINVLRGEMSLVGPRPLLEEYLPLYTEEQQRRHDVLPGLTGWAQVNGRNILSWADKFRMDVWYVDHWTFWLDLRILMLTPLVVFAQRGIHQPGRATVDRFTGHN